MPNDFIPSRRRLVMLASAALGTSLLGGIGRLALADADDDDSDNHFEDSANTSFTLANTGLKARVVVVGGGMAGATVAKYLRLWGGSGVQVTLVEPNPRYTSNIMSNLVLSGSRNISTLGYTYASLSAKYGVTVKQGASLVPVLRKKYTYPCSGPRSHLPLLSNASSQP